MSVVQTCSTSPRSSLPSEPKKELLQPLCGRSLFLQRTPAIVIDRQAFARNCQAMKDRCEHASASFRAHVKSHKTAEGVRLQLQTSPPSHAVVCSTLREAWGLVDDGLTRDETVKDILYGFPLPVDKIDELIELQKHVEVVTVMVDCAAQVEALDAHVASEVGQRPSKPLQAFIKIDQGGERAGIKPEGEAHVALLRQLIDSVWKSPVLKLRGFYTHSGNAYASRSTDDAKHFLSLELEACKIAHALALQSSNGRPEHGPDGAKFVLAVGSTPTAHVSSKLLADKARDLQESNFSLEIHAGVYPLLDLQQRSTSLVADPECDLALGVLARVCSVYPQRTPMPQVLIDAGAIAFSKDTGPTGNFGEVYSEGPLKGWQVKKISQEHGLLAPPERMLASEAGAIVESLELGTLLRIRPQHACLTCAAHAWYYIVDGPQDDTIRDVWVPWKGW